MVVTSAIVRMIRPRLAGNRHKLFYSGLCGHDLDQCRSDDCPVSLKLDVHLGAQTDDYRGKG
jgi:hypothetical protein